MIESAMNPLIRLLAVAALAFAGRLAAEPTPFEGTYTWTVDRGDGRPIQTTTSIKGKLMRSETVSGLRSFATIIDFGKRETIVLMPERKLYYRSNLTDLRALRDLVPPATDQAIAPTNESATILGYACRKTVATSRINGKPVTSELWWTDQLGTIVLPDAGSSAPTAKEADALLRGDSSPKDAFVLVADVTVEGGSPVRMAVTSVQRQSLDAALFEPPADWTEFKVPSAAHLPGGAN
jgi:hypothetical protein